ncbi:Uncharacterized protein Rs2_35731 [Raphanus sativus]|nr:Uncharacterized protein Rs2_35731 [Raphanus sativus]
MFKFNNSLEVKELLQNKLLVLENVEAESHNSEVEHDGAVTRKQAYIGKRFLTISELVLLKLVVICYFPRGYGSGVERGFSVDAGTTAVVAYMGCVKQILQT